MIEGDLAAGIDEFLASAKEEEGKCRFRSAITLYFKAIALACDFVIYRKLRKVSSNHGERFRLLEAHFPSIYFVVDEVFLYYTDTYSKAMTKEYCEKLREALADVFRLGGIEKKV